MTAAYHDPIGLTLSGGRYAITAKLGEGGMGAVYRAIDKNLGSDVVIKLLHRPMVTDAEFSRRFRDEVRSLVRLSHPHIVKITDVGEWDDVPFAVLQFLPGGSLDDRLAEWSGPAALAALMSWLGPVSSALDYVHSQKMVHRDVKPGNILFDAQGHPFLGDFGVVKVLAAAADDRSSRTAMTGAGMVLGTPHYMAPELIMGDPFDGRVDQYALAITAYELLCGRRPFEHDVPTRVLMMQTQDEPPSLASLYPWVSPRLEAALLKGLAKCPDDRYPTCAAFSAALVEASGVEQAGRARIRCGSCGKSIKVAVEMLAKLSRARRNAPCPNCGSLLDLAAGTATVITSSSPSGESSRSATAILDIRGSMTEIQALRPRDVPPPPGRGTVVFGSIPADTIAKPRPEPLAEHGGRNEPRHSPLSWVPFGIAAAVTSIACAALFAVLSAGHSKVSEPPATEIVEARRGTPVTEPVPRGLVARNDVNQASIPGPPGRPGNAAAGLETRPVVTPSPVPLIAAPAPKFDTPARPGTKSELEARSQPEGGAEPPGTTVSEGPSPTGGGAGQPAGVGSESTVMTPEQGGAAAVPEPEPGAVPESERVADDEEPSQRNVPLRKLQANPDAFAGQLITLEQVYCVGNLPWRMPDGSLRVAMIESSLELTNNSARVRLGDRFDIGLDQRLADQLVQLGKMSVSTDSKPISPSWIMQPANLTVKVSDSPGRKPGAAARIVRVEMFERFRNEVRGSAKKRLIVLFVTQTITPEGTSTGLGNNDEWQKVRKLGHAYNQFQRFFDGIQRQNSEMKWAAFDNQLNRLIGDGIRQSAAAQAASQRQILEMMTPRSPR